MAYFCYDEVMRILFFGDSITQGFWASDAGWVELLRRHYDRIALEDLQNRNAPTIFNMGVSGDTTDNLLARIESETKVRIWKDDPIIVVIAIGTNDDVFESFNQQAPSESYKANLQQIIDKVKPIAQDVVLIGSTACDEKLTNPVSWDNVCYTNRELEHSEQVIKQVAEANDLVFIPLFGQFKAELDAGKDLLEDGLHPNDNGHVFIADVVLSVLDKLISR
jgi:lysophospholipase L1-like esterase